MNEKLLNTKELASYLCVAVSTLLLYRAEGTEPQYIKMGQLVRYRAGDVETWLAERDGAKMTANNVADVILG